MSNMYITRVELITLVVIGTDCTGSCKSNYYTITTTTAPRDKELKMSTCDLLTDKGILSIDMTYMYVVDNSL
jgi:hypothetical protein